MKTIFIFLQAIVVVFYFSFSISNAKDLSFAEIERAIIKASPSMMPVLKAEFPKEYNNLVKSVTKQANGFGTKELKSVLVRRTARNAITKVYKKNAKRVFYMPDRDLKAILRAIVSTAKLAKNNNALLCNQFLEKGGDVLINSSRSYLPHLDRMGGVILKGVSKSRKSNIKVAKATDSDWLKFIELSKLTEEEINEISKFNVKNASHCGLMIKFLENVISMPGLSGKKIRADLVKDTLKG